MWKGIKIGSSMDWGELQRVQFIRSCVYDSTCQEIWTVHRGLSNADPPASHSSRLLGRHWSIMKESDLSTLGP
jgi:hypothetical protein